ncbi:MAG: hypothetical protein KGI71_05370 [Patescibacteria group bacterium]|nr:hypothetical protein [Patescibacteria group bacterium]
MNGGPSQQKGTVADPFAVANTGHPQDPFASAPYQSAPVDTPDPENNPWMAAGTHALNIAQGLVPGGMRAFEAFMGMLGSHIPGNTPMTYPQSLATLDQMTGTIPKGARVAEQILGGLPLASGKAVLGGVPMLERAVEGRNLLAASPVLAGAELGAASGALNADPESTGQRIAGTLTGGLLGGAAGGLAHGLTGAGGMVARRFMPEIGVRGAARNLLAPADLAEMFTANELAPGGASVATSSRPEVGLASSRFLPMIRAIGENPVAAAHAESDVIGQKAALNSARKAVGNQMQQITGQVPATSDLRSALLKASDLIGEKRVPSLRTDQESGTNGYDVQDLRDALSRLRFGMRSLEKRGTEAPGITKKDYADVIQSITNAVNDFSPTFGRLDDQYARIMNQTRAANDVLKTVQRSRANYAGTDAFSKDAESLGASIHGRPSLYMHLRNILTNPSGTAEAVRRLVVQPGGPELMANLLKPPVTTPADLARYSLLAANPLVPHP